MRSFLLSAMGILAAMILGSLITLNAFAQNQAAQVSGLITDPSSTKTTTALELRSRTAKATMYCRFCSPGITRSP
jgi:hypothetical protein